MVDALVAVRWLVSFAQKKYTTSKVTLSGPTRRKRNRRRERPVGMLAVLIVVVSEVGTIILLQTRLYGLIFPAMRHCNDRSSTMFFDGCSLAEVDQLRTPFCCYLQLSPLPTKTRFLVTSLFEKSPRIFATSLYQTRACRWTAKCCL